MAVGQERSIVAKLFEILRKAERLKYTTIVVATTPEAVQLPFWALCVGCVLTEEFCDFGEADIWSSRDLQRSDNAWGKSSELEDQPGMQSLRRSVREHDETALTKNSQSVGRNAGLAMQTRSPSFRNSCEEHFIDDHDNHSDGSGAEVDVSFYFPPMFATIQAVPSFMIVSSRIATQNGGALGTPIDGAGPIQTQRRRRVELEVLDITSWQSVHELMTIGMEAVDSLIPIGRGQRDFMIGDKTNWQDSGC
eukprot:TRINITY_DN38522_c0_g1_i1.p1 TRINITY_DN38522_c0_g1~~TRINITY_DN38522_c0_g1_i1.p1  ORF type:complete len:250 (-),score=36.84 TRINITY_DN38522_c0_g1_i1:838-1587(-)